MKMWQFFMLVSFIFAAPKVSGGFALAMQVSMLIVALVFAYLEVIKK